MLARLSAFVIWALVAGAVVFWGLRLAVTAPAAPSYAVAVGDVAVARGDLSALMGSAPVAVLAVNAPPPAASRFHLYGIVAPKVAADMSTRGVALIAVDGKMPKAYSVGTRIDGEMLLKSVSLRTVSIGNAGADSGAITLELPLPTPAATGSLPAGGASPGAAFGGMPAARGIGQPVPQITPQITPQLMPQYAPPQMPPGQGRPDAGAPVS